MLEWVHFYNIIAQGIIDNQNHNKQMVHLQLDGVKIYQKIF